MSIAESNSHGTIQDLYDQGAYLRAYDAALAAGLFDDDGPDALVLRSRLAANLGAPRKSTALTLRALRKYPNHPRVRYFGVRSLLSTRGPWEARQAWLEFEASARPDDPMRADWIAMKGMLAGMLRDFDTADQALDEAQRLDPDNPWLYVERSEILTYEDRHDEALEAARQALVCRPDYRPAVQTLAARLESQNRADEAIALLNDVAERIESGAVFYQLAGLLCDARRFDETHAALERIPPLWPLTEKSHVQSLAAFHSRCAYFRGDEPAAIEFAKQAKTKYYDAVAERLSQATEADKRVLLEVPFVRQNYSTCGPATLSALSGYWGKPADHLEVAEKICFDGTTSQSERGWAEQAGYHVREFAVDLTTAKALIDRGVPFTLTTTDVTSSHLQAVVGYDARLGVLLVRDSNFRTYAELIAEKGLEYYRPTGPRGMAMVPQEERARLDGLTLPDAELYDRNYELSCALDRFDRPAAAEALEQMRALDPNHRLTLLGRRALAAFDGDSASGRTACEQLVKLFPEADVYLYPLWFTLRRLAPLAERMAFLEGVLKRHDCDPAFRLHKAEELCDDARTYVEAERLLRRIIRTRGFEPRAYFLLGNLFWTERRFDEAREVYFAAACLGAKDEEYAKAYFSASRRVKDVDRALDFLRARFSRFGAKSPYAGRTLFTCLNILDRMDDAFAVLDEALRLRPDDGSLLLFAADAHARSGRFDTAEEFRRRAEGKGHPGEFLYRTADIATMRGDLTTALDTWRKLQEQEPQSVDAAAAIARLIGDADGRPAAYRYIVELVERFPHNIELLQLAAEMLRDDEPAEAERLVRRLIEHNPIDPWARRELALDLIGLKRFEEALTELDVAESLEPTNPWLYSIRAGALEPLSRRAEARLAYRRTLELGIDHTSAIAGLMRLSTSHAERLEALDFVYRQLAGQTSFGDGILCYAQYAGTILPSEQVLENLQRALAERPDLWHAWSAVVRQLQQMSRFDEARELARRETERFSLVPGSWLDLAAICRAQGDEDEEIASLEHALEINPTWTEALRTLCQAYERRGEFEKARTFMLQAVRRAPSDAVLFGYLADLHWQADERTEALAALERAVALEPGYDWGWRRLAELGHIVGEHDRAANAARALAERVPLQARSWMVLAEALEGPDTLDERRAAVDRALELNPTLISAYVLRSRLLIEAGDFDAAEAAVRPTCFGDALPAPLGLQRAEVLDARGDRTEAIAEVDRLVAEHPDFRSGWIKLAAWHSADDQEGNKYLAAAEALVRLDSQEAFFQRHLAEARLRLKDEAGACEAYRRALELEPGYEYCANCLIDLALDKGDYAEADRWLEHVMERHPTAFALARHVRAYAMRELFDQAVPSLERICRMDMSDNDWPLRSSVEMFNVPQGRKFARRVLSAAMNDPEAVPAVFTVWVELCAAGDEWPECEQALKRHRDRRPHWVLGAQKLLSIYGERELGDRALKFINADRDALAAEDDTWGEAAYALFCGGFDEKAVRWSAEWRDREGRRPWMMISMGEARVMLDDLDGALAIYRDACSLRPDPSISAHHLSVAFCEAIRGNWQAAKEELDQVEVDQLTKEHAQLNVVVTAFVEAMTSLETPSSLTWWSALGLQRRLSVSTREARQALAEVRLGRRVAALIEHRAAVDLGNTLYAWWIRATRLRRNRQ